MHEVLVVEDDRTYRTILIKALQRAGFIVSEASSGLGVMERMRTGSPAVIVTDIFMPDMDGLELIRTIRHVNRHIMIIAVSGGGPAIDFLPAASIFGADLTLRKPLDLGILVAAIRARLDEQPVRIANAS